MPDERYERYVREADLYDSRGEYLRYLDVPMLNTLAIEGRLAGRDDIILPRAMVEHVASCFRGSDYGLLGLDGEQRDAVHAFLAAVVGEARDA